MKVLIADDDAVSRTKLSLLCEKWGYKAVTVDNGDAAWQVLRGASPPMLALLDWHMPGLTGDEICRSARAQLPNQPLHIILITATRTAVEERVTGLGAGADDYLTKDYDAAELRARLEVGERLVRLQTELRRKVKELQLALAQVHQLQGLLPICMDCKKIRDDQNYWHQVERYISARADVAFTHSLCPTCFKKRITELQLRG